MQRVLQETTSLFLPVLLVQSNSTDYSAALMYYYGAGRQRQLVSELLMLVYIVHLIITSSGLIQETWKYIKEMEILVRVDYLC
jgi:hypothetical protein